MEVQLQSAVLQKSKFINPQDPVSSLRQFIKVRPVSIRKVQVITQDLKNLQSLLAKFTLKHIHELLNKFSQSECEIVLDYLHKFMKYVGQEKSSSGPTLSLEEQIIKKWGPMIVIQAASREDSVNMKVENGF